MRRHGNQVARLSWRPAHALVAVRGKGADGFAAEGEIAMLDHILRFMTLGTIIVGITAIYTALHTNNRRLGADIFLRYSERISGLRRRLPTAAFRDEGLPAPLS